jgi:hypothetical protein
MLAYELIRNSIVIFLEKFDCNFSLESCLAQLV